jgi:DNA-binding MarR family transcriptional regulator
MEESVLQEQMMTFVRTFGLHKPDETPCGQPIPVAEAYALTELAKENQLSQHDLVQRLNLAKSTVSRMVKKLVKRGWISRERSQDDGRVWLLSLTEAGVNTAVNLSQARQTKFAQILNHIPESEQENVLNALATLIQAMHQSDG